MDIIQNDANRFYKIGIVHLHTLHLWFYESSLGSYPFTCNFRHYFETTQCKFVSSSIYGEEKFVLMYSEDVRRYCHDLFMNFTQVSKMCVYIVVQLFLSCFYWFSFAFLYRNVHHYSNKAWITFDIGYRAFTFLLLILKATEYAWNWKITENVNENCKYSRKVL